MEQMINVIGGYGALGACLVYFMVKDMERTKCDREQFGGIVKDFKDILQEIRDMLLVNKGAL